MKISIVMAYYNRRKHLYNTLCTIEKADFKDFEVIIVDDGSDDTEKVNDYNDQFEFDIKVIELKKEDRQFHMNPCVVYNRGFKEATGEIIMIQNPECLHMGDVLTFTAGNLKTEEYYSYGCYSIDRPSFVSIDKLDFKSDNVIKMITDIITPMKNSCVHQDGQLGWYNHSEYRPKGYHFLSAIYKSELDALGGFDERYTKSIGYDDDEILARIKRKGMKVIIVNVMYCIHQFHDHRVYIPGTRSNKELYLNTTLKETGWKANK